MYTQACAYTFERSIKFPMNNSNSGVIRLHSIGTPSWVLHERIIFLNYARMRLRI
ncbi:unnamed protein product [Nesidiocoris tenuis]|uniref:Uncharacterized protein n=1 Tax=Nesidiocoris tenuis TaxID=355587 RepID=A0A6H5H453_9HEMI|nr:unnamed protein product [Nesidiocoris tenuis]